MRPGSPAARVAAVVLAAGLAVVAGGCGIAASTEVPSVSAAPVGPDATVSPAVAQTRALIANALAPFSLQLQNAKQPFRPAESPRLATAPRAVYQVVLPQDPEAGYIVVYEFRDAGEAVNAGNEFAGYVGSGGPGKVLFPLDVQHTIRQPERGRMRQVEAKAKVQAKDYTENQKAPTIFFTVFTQPQP